MGLLWQCRWLNEPAKWDLVADELSVVTDLATDFGGKLTMASRAIAVTSSGIRLPETLLPPFEFVHALKLCMIRQG
jgi:hypothetical protein